MKLWRIAAETREYQANDLSGVGSAIMPGRWNVVGEPVVYCSPSIAIAVLETVAHIKDAGLPLHRYLVEIDVPDDTWDQRQQIALSSLSATWSAIPAGMTSVSIGSKWLADGITPILLAPSVIVPEESVTLINPRHPLAAKITARAIRLFEYNRLFRS